MFLRDVKRSLRGSNYLVVRNSSVLAPNKSIVFTLDERFKPYDDVLIMNLDYDNDCTVTANYNFQQPLPKGNSLKIDFPCEVITIKNNGSTNISINGLEVYYRSSSKVPQLLDTVSKISLLRGLI